MPFFVSPGTKPFGNETAGALEQFFVCFTYSYDVRCSTVQYKYSTPFRLAFMSWGASNQKQDIDVDPPLRSSTVTTVAATTIPVILRASLPNQYPLCVAPAIFFPNPSSPPSIPLLPLQRHNDLARPKRSPDGRTRSRASLPRDLKQSVVARPHSFLSTLGKKCRSLCHLQHRPPPWGLGRRRGSAPTAPVPPPLPAQPPLRYAADTFHPLTTCALRCPYRARKGSGRGGREAGRVEQRTRRAIPSSSWFAGDVGWSQLYFPPSFSSRYPIFSSYPIHRQALARWSYRTLCPSLPNNTTATTNHYNHHRYHPYPTHTRTQKQQRQQHRD